MRPDGRTRLVPLPRPHPIGRLCDATPRAHARPTPTAAARLFLARRVAVTPFSCPLFLTQAAPKFRFHFASSPPPISCPRGAMDVWYSEPKPRMIWTRRAPAPGRRAFAWRREARWRGGGGVTASSIIETRRGRTANHHRRHRHTDVNEEVSQPRGGGQRVDHPLHLRRVRDARLVPRH